MGSRGERKFDLAVIGAGIVGLAHAYAAAQLGKRVIVIDRDTRANGASIRNFGFITVSGQERGVSWRRAMRSRDVWAEVAPQAGIEIVQRGFLMVARRPEASKVTRGATIASPRWRRVAFCSTGGSNASRCTAPTRR